jgi:hypothetical protein
MKTSEVFKQAKQHLAKDFKETLNGYRHDKEKFICIALITAAANCKRITEEDVKRCTAIVESRIDTYTLEGWLVDRGCIPDAFLNDHNILDRIQAHRHAWLDLLIAEFEAQGD